MTAMRRWTEALHPRIGGKFAPKGGAVGRRFIVEREGDDLRRYASSIKPRRRESEVRRRLRKVQDTAALASGRRQPRNFSEELDLQYASPQKRAEQFARTGDYKMPRAEAIRRNVHTDRKIAFGHKEPRVVTKRTPSGRVHVTRGYGIPGTEREYADTSGHHHTVHRPRNLAGRSRAAQRMAASAQHQPAARDLSGLEHELRGLRTRGLAEVAARYGVTISPLDTDARAREKILAAARKASR